MSDTNIIHGLIEILFSQERNDLADLLTFSNGQLIPSSSYGNVLNSVLSTYEIASPPAFHIKLVNLPEGDKDLIFQSVLHFFPLREGEPEITDIVYIADASKSINKNAEIIDSQPNSPLSIFISYSHIDKAIAGGLKEVLEQYGISCFLAHEDIEPSQEWESKIRDTLKTSDILIPILTENFPNSIWTNQEIGFALAYNKLIIPLKININPYGFIAKIQALQLKPNEGYYNYYSNKDALIEMIAIIKNNPKLSSKLKVSLIEALVKSATFQDAENKASLLTDGFSFSEDDIHEILKGTSENSQLGHSFGARTFLVEIVSQAPEKFKPLLKKLPEFFKSYY